MNLYGTNGADTLTGGAGDDLLYGYRGADILRGGAGHDTLAGNEGADKLYGGDGDDYLLGGPGDDLIDGGAGHDWAAYEDATAGVVVDLTQTSPQDTGGGGKDTLVGIENLYGSAFNDRLFGDAGDNYLYGGAGDDDLSGGAGDDHLSGGPGANYFFGGAGFDTVDYAWSDKGVVIDIKTVAPPLGGRAGRDMFFDVEAVMGSAHNDDVTGNTAENYLFGDAGDDILRGVGGHDTLDGGEGDDTLHASETVGEDGIGDVLVGGKGTDTLHGGAGADTFVFAPGDTTWSASQTDASLDVITDFDAAKDTLVFETNGERYGEILFVREATSWLGAASVAPAHIHSQRLAYVAVQVGEDTYVFASGPTTGASMNAEHAVKLVGVDATTLTIANFG